MKSLVLSRFMMPDLDCLSTHYLSHLARIRTFEFDRVPIESEALCNQEKEGINYNVTPSFITARASSSWICASSERVHSPCRVSLEGRCQSSTAPQPPEPDASVCRACVASGSQIGAHATGTRAHQYRSRWAYRPSLRVPRVNSPTVSYRTRRRKPTCGSANHRA